MGFEALVEVIHGLLQLGALLLEGHGPCLHLLLMSRLLVFDLGPSVNDALLQLVEVLCPGLNLADLGFEHLSLELLELAALLDHCLGLLLSLLELASAVEVAAVLVVGAQSHGLLLAPVVVDHLRHDVHLVEEVEALHRVLRRVRAVQELAVVGAAQRHPFLREPV